MEVAGKRERILDGMRHSAGTATPLAGGNCRDGHTHERRTGSRLGKRRRLMHLQKLTAQPFCRGEPPSSMSSGMCRIPVDGRAAWGLRRLRRRTAPMSVPGIHGGPR